MTSAPRWASICVQAGPAQIHVKSHTRTPSSGRLARAGRAGATVWFGAAAVTGGKHVQRRPFGRPHQLDERLPLRLLGADELHQSVSAFEDGPRHDRAGARSGGNVGSVAPPGDRFPQLEPWMTLISEASKCVYGPVIPNGVSDSTTNRLFRAVSPATSAGPVGLDGPVGSVSSVGLFDSVSPVSPVSPASPASPPQSWITRSAPTPPASSTTRMWASPRPPRPPRPLGR